MSGLNSLRCFVALSLSGVSVSGGGPMTKSPCLELCCFLALNWPAGPCFQRLLIQVRCCSVPQKEPGFQPSMTPWSPWACQGSLRHLLPKLCLFLLCHLLIIDSREISVITSCDSLLFCFCLPQCFGDSEGQESPRQHSKQVPAIVLHLELSFLLIFPWG